MNSENVYNICWCAMVCVGAICLTAVICVGMTLESHKPTPAHPAEKAP